MHMADALISPITGGLMWTASAGLAGWSIRKLQQEADEKKIPLMGVMGAFVFAAQMINFTIPGTGSSGHLGGGLLLSALLDPYAGFLTMMSILVVQALFFADGGLLALGCNVFNLGFYTCFIIYPLIYKRWMRKGPSPARIWGASLVSAVVGLQLGAFSVVLETILSNRTSLSFSTFVLFMQPIHLAIGVVEGLVTAAVITFVWKMRPDILSEAAVPVSGKRTAPKQVIVILTIAALLTGGILSWFASSLPDGLEWSIAKTAEATEELESSDPLHRALANIQEKLAFLPDYGFKAPADRESSGDAGDSNAWPAVNSGTSVSGLAGGVLTLALAILTGWGIRRLKKRKSAPDIV